MGRKGSAFWYCTRFIMRYLGEKPKAGKGRDLGGSGGTRMGKQKDKGTKGHVWRGCWSVCLCGCTMHLISTVCTVFSLNSISNAFPGWEVCTSVQITCECTCACVHACWERMPSLAAAWTWGMELLQSHLSRATRFVHFLANTLYCLQEYEMWSA